MNMFVSTWVLLVAGLVFALLLSRWVLALDRGAAHLKDELMPRYAELVYNGLWFSPEREMLQAAIDLSQEKVSGTVRLKLYKGSSTVAGRTASRARYSKELATYDPNSTFDEAAAAGFIALWGLPARQWAGVNGGIESPLSG